MALPPPRARRGRASQGTSAGFLGRTLRVLLPSALAQDVLCAGDPPRSPAPPRHLGGMGIPGRVQIDGFYTLSTAMATALPPPRHSETMPRLAPRSFMA